jgi:hypothetical protein
MGHLVDFFSHGLMHSIWNLCKQRGNTVTSSLSSKSHMHTTHEAQTEGEDAEDEEEAPSLAFAAAAATAEVEEGEEFLADEAPSEEAPAPPVS